MDMVLTPGPSLAQSPTAHSAEPMGLAGKWQPTVLSWTLRVQARLALLGSSDAMCSTFSTRSKLWLLLEAAST